MIIYLICINIFFTSTYNRSIHQLFDTGTYCCINCSFMCSSSFRSYKRHGNQYNSICSFKCFHKSFCIIKISHPCFNSHFFVLFKCFFSWCSKNQILMRIFFQKYSGRFSSEISINTIKQYFFHNQYFLSTTI